MPRAVDHDRQKADIARAAIRVMARDGLERATMRKIAAELGSTTGLLTHYFADRDALVAYALDVQDAGLFAYLEAAGEGVENGREALRRLILRLGTPANTADDSVFFQRLAAIPHDPALRDRSHRMYDRFEAMMLERIEAARNDGSLSPATSLRDAADSLMVTADGIYSTAIARPDRYPAERCLALIDMALDGLEHASES
jgi:AcrR family transcriptional regulator